MILQRSETPLRWGALDLHLLGLNRDVHDREISPPAAFALAVDAEALWLVAARTQPASLHPLARPGIFQKELWHYDVAELFLAHPGGRYLEFNLAPNGAWWSCEFTAPRVRAEEVDIPFPGLATYADLSPEGGWLTAMAIPLDVLRARLDFGPTTTGNVTFILDSPQQRFLSACPLGTDTDFHQPEKFRPLRFA